MSSPVRHVTQLELPVNLGGRRKLLWLTSHHFWASLVAQLVKNLPVFNLCVGKISWRRERLPTPPFWPGEFHELYSPQGHKESETTKLLSLSPFLPGCSLEESHSQASKSRHFLFHTLYHRPPSSDDFPLFPPTWPGRVPCTQPGRPNLLQTCSQDQ